MSKKIKIIVSLKKYERLKKNTADWTLIDHQAASLRQADKRIKELEEENRNLLSSCSQMKEQVLQARQTSTPQVHTFIDGAKQ